MTVERIYRQEGLTIAMLAARLDLPEHRLRQVINEGLGTATSMRFSIATGLTRPRPHFPT